MIVVNTKCSNKDCQKDIALKIRDRQKDQKYFFCTKECFMHELNAGREYTQIVSKKRKKTLLDRYGAETTFGSKEIQKKSKETVFAKHGTTCYAQTEEWREKTKKTNQEKRGVDWVTQSSEFLENLDYAANKRKETETRKRKGLMFVSAIEKQMEVMLQQIFSTDDVVDQEHIGLNPVDFYIKSLLYSA